MEIVSTATNNRAKTKNALLNKELLVKKQLINKEQIFNQRKLEERSKECISVINQLKEDAKKLQKIDRIWHVLHKNNYSETDNKRSFSAILPRYTQNENSYKISRPSTAKSAHVYKFEKIKSEDPETDAFQVHCHKIKEPLSESILKSNPRSYVPKNMCRFEDEADWNDVLRATNWIDKNSKGGREFGLDAKSPVIVAEFESHEPDIYSQFKINAPYSAKEIPKNASPENNITNNFRSALSSEEKRKTWQDAFKQIFLMSSALGGFSHAASINLEQMKKIHNSEMKKAGLKSALESKKQLELAKAVEQSSGMEPMSDRELKQKILVAKGALQKDIEEAKMAKHRLKEKLLLTENHKNRNIKQIRKVSNREESIELSSDDEEEEFDLLKQIILPNLRLNDEMEKSVTQYLEKHGIQDVTKKSRTISIDQSSNTTPNRNTEINLNSDQISNIQENNREWYQIKKNKRKIMNLLERDKQHSDYLSSITTTSLLNRLRNLQRKYLMVDKCRRDLEASIKRIDKARPNSAKY